MAIVKSGLFGQFRGKVGGLVGAQWKNVPYVREYTKPANPNTALQQAQRAKMAACVAFSKPLVGPVFNAYTERFYKGMSGFNAFIRGNIARFGVAPDYDLVNLTEGKLSNILVTEAVYDTGGPDVTIAYLPNLGNNGSNDDAVYAAVYYEPTGFWYFPGSEDSRDGSPIVITVPAGLVATSFHTYTWAVQYINTLVNLISYSFYQVGEVP